MRKEIAVAVLIMTALAVATFAPTRYSRLSSNPHYASAQSAELGVKYVMGNRFYPYSTQPQPNKAETVTDSTFHIPVTRISNGASDHKGGDTAIGYSTWNPLSSDGNYLLLGGSGYTVYNAHTFAYIRATPLEWWNSQDPEPRWDYSGEHPTWLYYRRDKQLRYYDVLKHSDNLVRDFTSAFKDIGSTYYVYNGEEGSPSRDQRYWAFIIRNAQAPYDSKLAFVYDRKADEIVGTKDVSSNWPNNIMMSPSGEYVYLAYDRTGKGGEFDGPHVYTRTFEHPIHVFTGIPHANFAWTKQGHEVIVGTGDDVLKGSDYFGFVRLDTGDAYTLGYVGDFGWNGGGANIAYTDQHGWTFWSQYGGPADHWDDQNIWAFELDETKTYDSRNMPRTWRIAFTQCFGDKYDQQANASMDYAGTRIWWGSNWRNPKGPMDVYQATLPAFWWRDLSDTAGRVERATAGEVRQDYDVNSESH